MAFGEASQWRRASGHWMRCTAGAKAAAPMPHPVIIGLMLTRYIGAAMKRARFKTLDDGRCVGEIPGLAGVWANESTLRSCREVLQEVLEEWLILKIRDGDPIPRLGRVGLSLKAA